MSADMPPEEFRAAMHRVAEMVADYLEGIEGYPVLPRVSPGEVAAALPMSPPDDPEPINTVLDDYRSLIEPAMTHWNHPGFMAYIAITGSGPGILGESLAAALNVNHMLWRTSPAATELEGRVCDWLRQMLALPAEFFGHINDTASMSTLLALASARQRAYPEARLRGLFDAPRMCVYCSDQTHSSIEKAAIALGLGLDQVRKIESDAAFRLKPAMLEAAIEQDLAAGLRPIAIVACAGTTSTASVDPIPEIVAIARRHRLWLHVDAAYAGGAAICPEYRALMPQMEQADSIVVNPHKWLFTPVDCSVLFTRDPEVLREAFHVLPEYLRTDDGEVVNLMDYGVQLGKRFRALKLWMVIRAFGVRGMQERIREHCRLAAWFADQVEADPAFELAAPVPFAIVAFRALLPGAAAEAEDDFNERLMARINAAGPVMLSHSKLQGRYVLRVVIGNLRTTERHVHAVWDLVRETAAALSAEEAHHE
jgi:aromatic-L-amino-acid decarboxylase